MPWITLERLREYARERNIKPKVYNCDDCWRELTKAELGWTKQNFQWLYCYNCQKNHSTKSSNKAFIHFNWDISFQPKYFKPKTIKQWN